MNPFTKILLEAVKASDFNHDQVVEIKALSDVDGAEVGIIALMQDGECQMFINLSNRYVLEDGYLKAYFFNKVGVSGIIAVHESNDGPVLDNLIGFLNTGHDEYLVNRNPASESYPTAQSMYESFQNSNMIAGVIG